MPKYLALFSTLAAALVTSGAQAAPAAALSEGFDNVPAVLLAGWTVALRGTAGATTDWFQGDGSVFAAHSGAAESYIAANYNSAPAGGAIATWLITPDLQLGDGGGVLSFYTRTDGTAYGDRLRVLFNPSFDINAADFNSELAGFTTVLADINSGEQAGGYPADWTQFTARVNALSGHGSIAFVYTQANADNANYIGIDDLHYAAVPEPASLGLAALALGGLAVSRRRARAA